jgi:hypothetical protein
MRIQPPRTPQALVTNRGFDTSIINFAPNVRGFTSRCKRFKVYTGLFAEGSYCRAARPLTVSVGAIR